MYQVKQKKCSSKLTLPNRDQQSIGISVHIGTMATWTGQSKIILQTAVNFTNQQNFQQSVSYSVTYKQIDHHYMYTVTYALWTLVQSLVWDHQTNICCHQKTLKHIASKAVIITSSNLQDFLSLKIHNFCFMPVFKRISVIHKPADNLTGLPGY